MLGYCTLGTNDLARAGAFYDGIAKIMGTGRVMESEKSILWGQPGQGAMLGVIKPYDGQAATVGNGSMFGIHATSSDLVDQVHAYALAHGGSDEGAPGLRGDNYYGAYFRDPDGNKLVVFQMQAPG